MIDEKDLTAQISGLDWGAETTGSKHAGDRHAITFDDVNVDIAGVAPVEPKAPREKRSHHKKKTVVVVGAAAPVVVEVASAPQASTKQVDVAPQVVGRDRAPDILSHRGEGPAVMALFETMWREVGHAMALEIGRPKASKQDAALGWYMLLEAMRQRDEKRA